MVKKQNPSQQRSFLEYVVGWGITVIFAVLPLVYFSDRAASYVTSKQYFLIGFVDIFLIFWTWLLLVDKRYRLSKQNLLWLSPLFLFLLSSTISGFVGVEPANSFFSTVESGTGLILLYHVFIFSCMIVSVIRVQQQKFLKYILQANLFASVVLAGMTFYTGNSGVFEIRSAMLDGSSGGATMGNSLLVGAYFIFSLFLTLYLITHESKTWKKILYWFGIAIMMFSPIYFNAAIFKGKALSSSYLFIGEARVALVALIIGLFLSLFIWLSTRKDKKAWRLVGTAGIIAMVIIGALGITEIANPKSAAHTFFVNQSGNRISDWGEAIQGIKAKPLLGWGPENFHAVHQLYFNPIVFSPGHGDEAWALHPHNNTLEILVDDGVIGLIFYLLVLGSLFGGLSALYRKDRIDAKTYALLMGMLVAFIIQQQMIYDSIVSYVMLFSIIAIVVGLMDVTNEQRQVSTASDTLIYGLGTAIAVVMIPIWIYAAYLPAQKMDEYQLTTTLTSDVRTSRYQHLFHSPGSYAIDTDAEFFTGPLFYSYYGDETELKTNPTYQKYASAEIQALITAVNPIAKDIPYDYHLRLTLIQLENLDYYLTANAQDLTQADLYFDQAVALSPTDPQIYTTYAQTLVYENKTPEAEEMLNKALELASTYQSAIDFKNMLESNNS